MEIMGVQEKISCLEAEIVALRREKPTDWQSEVAALRETVKQLREEKKQLRKKEEQLRDDLEEAATRRGIAWLMRCRPPSSY